MIADIGMIVGIASIARLLLLAHAPEPGRWVSPLELAIIALAVGAIGIFTADLLMQGLAGAGSSLPSTLPRR